MYIIMMVRSMGKIFTLRNPFNFGQAGGSFNVNIINPSMLSILLAYVLLHLYNCIYTTVTNVIIIMYTILLGWNREVDGRGRLSL